MQTVVTYQKQHYATIYAEQEWIPTKLTKGKNDCPLSTLLIWYLNTEYTLYTEESRSYLNNCVTFSLL